MKRRCLRRPEEAGGSAAQLIEIEDDDDVAVDDDEAFLAKPAQRPADMDYRDPQIVAIWSCVSSRLKVGREINPCRRRRS